MIYVGSPYTHSDAEVREARYRGAMKYTAELMLKYKGIFIFSPIVHCHELAKLHDLPHTIEFWQEYCFASLDYADEFHMLKLPGWEESKGLRAEHDYVEQLNAYGSDITIEHVPGAEYYSGPEF